MEALWKLWVYFHSARTAWQDLVLFSYMFICYLFLVFILNQIPILQYFCQLSL